MSPSAQDLLSLPIHYYSIPESVNLLGCLLGFCLQTVFCFQLDNASSPLILLHLYSSLVLGDSFTDLFFLSAVSEVIPLTSVQTVLTDDEIVLSLTAMEE